MANKSFFKQFNSINELIRTLDNAKTSKGWGNCLSQYRDDPDEYGYNSYEEARDMILKGDNDLAKQLRGTENLDINIPVTGTRRKMCTRVAGFAPHVPNYIVGVPNDMLWVEEKKASSPVLTIVYNIACLGSSSGSLVTKVSARIMSAIMSAERKGYRINLFVASAQHESDSNEDAGFICKIKDAGQHIDTLKMAVPMISPAMNRRFGFRFRETLEGLSVYDWRYGYGASMKTGQLENWLKHHGFKYDVALAFESVKYISSVEELEKIFVDAANKIKNK